MLRLLLAGDLHLGRASTRLEHAASVAEVSCAGAWRALVDLAIDERVDLVLLSGDLVDADDRFWEARAALEGGVRRLGAKGIRTLAVAGNHDWDVLPRVARALPPEHFRLLGDGGAWERETIERDGRPVLHVDGWSFPQRTVAADPVAAYDRAADPAVPALGIVHGDLDAAASPYAPLDRQRLALAPVAAWLLGHLHDPGLREAGGPGAPWILYPGSLQAMDPGETGAHGAWRADLEHGRLGPPVLRPLSSVRYERLAVDLEGADDGDAVEARTDRALLDRTPALVAAGGPRLQHLVLRLVLSGRTRAHDEAAARTEGLCTAEAPSIGRVRRHVDAVRNETLPDIDLHDHARGTTPVSALARLLLALDGDETYDVDERLLVAVREAAREARARREYAALANEDVAPDAGATDEPDGDASARGHLRDAARLLLGTLVEQVS